MTSSAASVRAICSVSPANFLYGFIPYKAWEALTDADPVPRGPASWVAFVSVVLLASAVCALTVGWGINLLGFVPFSVLGNIILVNNFVVAVVLTPFLLAVIYPRVKRGQLLYRDIMQRAAPIGGRRPHRARRRLGLAVVVVATVAGMVLGNLLSTGQLQLPFLTSSAAAPGTHAAAVGIGLLPVMVLLIIGVALL